MRGGEALRLAVACREAPRIAHEARTPDDAVAIVREAVEGNAALRAMGAASLDERESLDLTGQVMDAMRPAMLRALARRRARRDRQERDGEGFMDDLERRLREEGHL